jgi:type I restriction enzyme S subunit
MVKSDIQKLGYRYTVLGRIPEEWNVKELGEVANITSSKRIYEEEYVKEGIPFYRTKEIVELSNHKPVSLELFISYEKYNEIKEKFDVPQKGDILLSAVGTIGISWVVADDQEFYFKDGNILWLKELKGIISSFLKCCLDELFAKEKNKLIYGGAYNALTIVNLKEAKIPLPSVAEQQTIVALLSKWGQVIELTQKVIAEKELRKKALMQKLLTGKKRLPGFNGSWMEYSLGDVFERITRRNKERNTNVVTISAQRGFVRQEDFFNKIVASEILDDYYLVEKGEFCYNKSYCNGYPWGATKRLKAFEKAVVTTLYICFGFKNPDRHSGDFFEYFFEMNSLDKGLTKIAHEGGRAHGLLNVTPSDFFGLKIRIPALKEQNAIAAILQKSYEEIILQKQKLEFLKQQKKGLMQVLLTGKKRTKGE